MSTVPQPLKYLWLAEYADGTTLQQPPDDKSTLHPYDPETDFQPSAFRDIDHSKLVGFHLYNSEHNYGVNLINGLFYIDGLWFQVHDQRHVITTPLKLVLNREVQRDMNSATGEITRWEVTKYFFGWQTNVKGKNIQHTIGVA